MKRLGRNGEDVIVQLSVAEIEMLHDAYQHYSGNKFDIVRDFTSGRREQLEIAPLYKEAKNILAHWATIQGGLVAYGKAVLALNAALDKAAGEVSPVKGE